MPDEKSYIEIWKKIVDVQQHFNDLELRIRNFALIVTGAFLAFGSAAIKEMAFLDILGRQVSLSCFIVLGAIPPLLAFYFMDKFWYHRLLDGAVKAGATIEAELKNLGFKLDLGAQVSAASPIDNWLYGKADKRSWWPIQKRKMHSRHKMDVFYGILLFGLIFIAGAIFVTVSPDDRASPPTSHLTIDWKSTR